MRTAPTQGLSPAERRVGEARVAELAALEIVDEALGLSAEVQCQRILYNEKVRVARDLLDERAAVSRLTAEVERLTWEAGELRALVKYAAQHVDERETMHAIRDRLAALSLPTPAPEATE
jgi:hypothetical protein